MGIALDRVGSLDPGSEPDGGPFSRTALADRAEALGREARTFYPEGDPRLAIGHEIARSFRDGRCQSIPEFAKVTSTYDQLYWSRRFYEIFPNGSRLADLLVRLDNTAIDSPKFHAPIESLVRDYYERAGEAPVPLMLTSDLRSLPQGEPLLLSRFAERLWSAAEATGRRAAASAATSHAQASARYIAPAIARSLESPDCRRQRPIYSALIPLEIARYGALWATVEDVVGSSAIEPLAIALSAGFVPVGEAEGRFVVVNTKRQGSLVVSGLRA